MELIELIRKNRSYRRFMGDRNIEMDDLKDLIDLSRYSASAANRQPLKFFISNEDKTNYLIFEELAWAGYLDDWDGPEEGERPTAYIVITGDTRIADDFLVDHGIAAQSILLGAVEKGMGGCMLAAFDKNRISSKLGLHDELVPLLVIALGWPVEEVIVEDCSNGDIRYYRDEKDRHHVPKRKFEDLILNDRY